MRHDNYLNGISALIITFRAMQFSGNLQKSERKQYYNLNKLSAKPILEMFALVENVSTNLDFVQNKVNKERKEKKKVQKLQKKKFYGTIHLDYLSALTPLFEFHIFFCSCCILLTAI